MELESTSKSYHAIYASCKLADSKSQIVSHRALMLAFGGTAIDFSSNLLPVSGGSHPAQACGREQQLHAVLYLGLIPSEAGVSSRPSAKSNTVYILVHSGAHLLRSILKVQV